VRLFAAAGASAALLLVPLASAATFGRAAEIPLSFQPVKIAVGDATQDGFPDIVTANASAPSMSLLPGRGDGSFEKPLHPAGAGGARSFVFGDFDGDGAEELAVATASSIVIYAGSDGALVRRQSYAAQAPTFLATGDFDSDGIIDLAATSATRAAVFVLRGHGDGTFDRPSELSIGSPASSLAVADLNGDDTLDIAAAGADVYELLGIGDGSFEASRAVRALPGLRSIAAEDLDGDGDADLVAVGGQNAAYVFLNDGSGAFPDVDSHRVGGIPVALSLDDVNSDGNIDIITANRATNDITVLEGAGDGGFGSTARVRVGRAPTSLSAVDLDSDGTTDLVVVNGKSKSLTVLLNGTDAPQPIVCLVPRVVHRTLAAARRIVARAHCTLAPIRRRHSNRVRRGRVIAQTPAPGVRLPERTSVALLISRGPRR